MNLSYKNKSIIMAVICACLVVAIGVTVYFLIDSLDGNNALEVKKEKEKKMYAVVSKTGNSFVKVDPIDGDEEVHINTSDKLSEGDFVVITYNEDEEASITPNNIEVIAKNKEVTITPNTSTTTTKSVYVSTTEKTTKSSTTTSTRTKTTTKITKTANAIATDDEIVELAKLSYEETDKASSDKSITSSIKEKFVLFIDFIFYGEKIKGKTFKELSDSAKAKVIYYTLLVDSKIDSKWPNYKSTIKSKASNLKERLIAKYMDITTDICENHQDGCQMVRDDFALLKKSLNITWDVIKSAFSYGYNKTYTYLKNWYEVWRDK